MRVDPRIVGLAASWWRKAVDDLMVAQRIQDLPFACCFHCQQAVEKAIKTLLVLQQIEFGRLHDIGQLLELLRASPAVPSESQVEGLESLTRFAVETRYPPGEALPEEAEDALRRAEAFLAWVRPNLPPEVGREGKW